MAHMRANVARGRVDASGLMFEKQRPARVTSAPIFDANDGGNAA